MTAVSKQVSRVRSQSRSRLFFAAGLCAAVLAILCLAYLVLSLNVSTVAFPSDTGTKLSRTRVELGSAARLESWYQDSQFSYSLRYSFGQEDEFGNPLSCRYELAGWYRTESRQHNWGKGSCVCERTAMHHDRTRDCVNLRFNDNWTQGSD